MSDSGAVSGGHPSGDRPTVEPASGVRRSPAVDTFAGWVHVEWAPNEAVTPLGQLPFFIDYLKQAGLFEPRVADCPLDYTSQNAPAKRDLLGTLVLALLVGAKRCVHVTALRNDGVNPALLGMKRVCSDDSVRRGLKTLEPETAAAWLHRHLDYVVRPLLAELEQRGQDYLFRLRMTANVKRQLPKLAAQRGWRDAGQGSKLSLK